MSRTGALCRKGRVVTGHAWSLVTRGHWSNDRGKLKMSKPAPPPMSPMHDVRAVVM